jgi:hypothetical protein
MFGIKALIESIRVAGPLSLDFSPMKPNNPMVLQHTITKRSYAVLVLPDCLERTIELDLVEISISLDEPAHD